MSLLYVSTLLKHELACSFHASLVRYRKFMWQVSFNIKQKKNILKTAILQALTQTPNSVLWMIQYLYMARVFAVWNDTTVLMHTWYQVPALLSLVCYAWACKLHNMSNLSFHLQQRCTEGRGGVCGVQIPSKFRRPSKIVPNSTRLWKLLKIAEFKTPTPQGVRKKRQ